MANSNINAEELSRNLFLATEKILDRNVSLLKILVSVKVDIFFFFSENYKSYPSVFLNLDWNRDKGFFYFLAGMKSD